MMKTKKMLRIGTVCVLLIFIVGKLFAQVPLSMPVRSRPDLFTFYTPGNPFFPPGSDLTSKSVIFLSGQDPEVDFNSLHNGSTAFVIRTFRDDDFVCVCMTGHQITARMPLVIPIPSTIHFNTTIAMDYLGSNNTVGGTNYVRINNFPTSFLSTGLLVGYYDDQIAGKDAALVLIDKRRLPSVDFGALGYDFTQITAFTGWNYYNISHAWAYPQRLSDHGIYQNSSVNSVDVAFNLPMGIGGGSSGSPVLNIASANDINSSVKGIAYSILNAVFYPEVTAGGNLTNNAYSTTVRFTRISALESAIRENCWKNSSRDEISRSGIYKQAVRVSNPKPALDINQTISTATDLLGSIAAFTETTTDGMKVTQLTANNCNIGSFTLPASYPASATSPWQVVVTAKQIDVNPGFSYTASGSSELDLTIVGNYGTESATSRLADTAGSSATDATTAGQMPGFKVYPNPSPDGLFYLELPQSEQPVVYKGAIVSIDGKLLQQLADMHSGGKVSFNLSQLPQGIYILKVQTIEGAIVFTTKITL